MKLIELFEALRSERKLADRYRSAYQKAPQALKIDRRDRRRRLNIDDWIEMISEYDPTADNKYLDWMCRTLLSGNEAQSEDAISSLYALNVYLKRFDRGVGKGKVNPDIYSYKTLDDFFNAIAAPDISVGKSKKKIKNFTIAMDDRRSGDSRNVKLLRDGIPIGSFIIDFKYRSDGVVTMHSQMDENEVGKGYASQVYNWIGKLMKTNYGLDLMPSDRLTRYSYAFWKKRKPEFMELYTTGSTRLDGYQEYYLPNPSENYRHYHDQEAAQYDLF